jgi:hypothetical protein
MPGICDRNFIFGQICVAYVTETFNPDRYAWHMCQKLYFRTDMPGLCASEFFLYLD